MFGEKGNRQGQRSTLVGAFWTLVASAVIAFGSSPARAQTVVAPADAEASMSQTPHWSDLGFLRPGLSLCSVSAENPDGRVAGTSMPTSPNAVTIGDAAEPIVDLIGPATRSILSLGWFPSANCKAGRIEATRYPLTLTGSISSVEFLVLMLRMAPDGAVSMAVSVSRNKIDWFGRPASTEAVDASEIARRLRRDLSGLLVNGQ